MTAAGESKVANEQTPEIIKYPLGDNPPTARLFYGWNVLDVLRELPENSVQVACTSPPYWGLRDYKTPPQIWGGDPNCDHEWGLGNGVGKNNDDPQPYGKGFCRKCEAWHGHLGLEPLPEMYIEHLVFIFRELRRVLRPDGTFWLNLGDSYSRGDSGCLPVWQDARAPSRGRLKIKSKDLIGMPWRVAFALQQDGWWLRNDIIWSKTNPMPSSVSDRVTSTHEHLFLFAKSERYFFDLFAIRVPLTYGRYYPNDISIPQQKWMESEGIDRKPDNIEDVQGPMAASPRKKDQNTFHPQGKNPGDVWAIATQPFPGAHFAVWPEKLVKRCILAGSSEKGACPACGTPWKRILERKKHPAAVLREKHRKKRREETRIATGRKDGYVPGPKGEIDQIRTRGWKPGCDCGHENTVPCIVMDPFSGSGTTGHVALKHGRDYIGIDLNKDYLDIARSRILGQAVKSWKGDDDPNLIEELFG